MAGLVATYLIVFFGALVSLRKPILGLMLYVGLSVLRPESLWGWAGNLRNMSRLVGVPLLVGWAFQGFGSWKFGRAKPIVSLLLLYMVWCMISTTQASVDAEASTNMLFEFTKTLLPFLLGVTMLKTEKELRQMLWVMVMMQTYVCIDMNRMYVEQGYNRPFMEGFGGMDNNAFGISLVTTIGAALGLLLSAKTWLTRIIAIGSMLLILHTILLTFSRGAFVGLLGVGVMAIVILPKRPKYLGAIALAVAVAFTFTGPELSARLGTTFAPREERDGSAESRFSLWRDCMTVISEEPILGVGPENWPLIADRFGWPPGKEAHSVWMQTAAEIGLPGVLFLLFFYLVTIKKLWPIARGRSPGTDASTAMFATGLILALVGFVISAQFVSLKGLEPPFYVAMMGAVLLKIRDQQPAAETAQTPQPARVPQPGAVRRLPPIRPIRPVPGA